MADATFKPSSGDDLVLSNDDASAKVEINEDGTIVLTGPTSFSDANISNVGDISLDSISSDAGSSIGVTLGTDSGDDFNVGSGKLLIEGDNGNVSVGSGNIVIGTAGKGIDFSNQSNPTAGMTSELFDHYEEGTFTPTLTCATSGTITLDSSNNTGSYTKIGRQVTVTTRFAISSQSSPSGDIRFHLPFTSNTQSENESEFYGTVWYYQLTSTSDIQFVFQVVSNTNYGRIQKMENDGGATSSVSSSDLANSFYGYTVTYFTA